MATALVDRFHHDDPTRAGGDLGPARIRLMPKRDPLSEVGWGAVHVVLPNAVFDALWHMADDDPKWQERATAMELLCVYKWNAMRESVYDELRRREEEANRHA